MSDGLFVVVEGPDGAGKTTLARSLASRMRAAGREVVEVREPGGTPVAEACRAIVLDPAHPVGPAAELFLMLAARADLVARVIEPALARGAVVLSDRFDLSTLAYQVAGRGLPEADVRRANAVATAGRTPDLTLVIDLPADEARSRRQAAGKALDRMEQGDAGMRQRVADCFVRASGPGVVHVDGGLSPDKLADRAWDHVRPGVTEPTPPTAG